MAEIIRGFIDKGMNIDGYKEETDFIRDQIREEIKSCMKPYMERMISLMVKTAYASATSKYLNAKALSEFVHPQRLWEFREALEIGKYLARKYIVKPFDNIDELLKDEDYIDKLKIFEERDYDDNY